MGLHQASVPMLELFPWWLCGTLTVGAGVYLTVLPALGTIFLPMHHLVQPPYFVLSYHILFCPV